MRSRSGWRAMGLPLAAVAWAVTTQAAPAEAAIRFDLRLDDGGGKSAVAAPGSTVGLDLFVMVTGADADGTNDGFASGWGSLLSGPNGAAPLLDGDLASSLTLFANTTGAQQGASADLDADGDLDVGSTSTSSNGNYLFARAGAAPLTTGGTAITFEGSAGQEWKLADVTFTLSPTASGETAINFNPALFSAGLNRVSQTWSEDGTTVQISNSTDADIAKMSVGAPVVVGVPEPAALGLALLALPMLGRRRRRRQ